MTKDQEPISDCLLGTIDALLNNICESKVLQEDAAGELYWFCYVLLNEVTRQRIQIDRIRMGAMKRYAEAVSESMGHDGEINEEVTEEGNRRIRDESIRTAIGQIGLQVMHMSAGTVTFEVSQIVGETISYNEIENALDNVL